MDKKNKAKLTLHIAVILFGFTAILGDLIEMSALMIVWWRVLITAFSLLFMLRMGRDLLSLTKKQVLIFLGIGAIVAAHWLSFYGSVKLSNASITLICMATTSFFTAMLEPLFFKRRISRTDVFLGMAMIPCMFLVVNGVDAGFYIGIAVGLFSAMTASLFSVFNKKYVDEVNVVAMSFYEMTGVFITLSIVLPFVLNSNSELVLIPPSSMDWIYIIVLALVCTTLAWVISLIALRQVTVFEANLIVNLEPVYGMVLAALILKEYEQLNSSFYLGASLILVIIILYPFVKARQKAKYVQSSK